MMVQNEYTTTITITVPILARSQAKAEERSQWLQEQACDVLYKLTLPWAGTESIDANTTVEETA